MNWIQFCGRKQPAELRDQVWSRLRAVPASLTILILTRTICRKLKRRKELRRNVRTKKRPRPVGWVQRATRAQTHAETATAL